MKCSDVAGWFPILLGLAVTAGPQSPYSISPALAAETGTGEVPAAKPGPAEAPLQFKLRGYVQTDGRFWRDDDLKPQSDTFLVRRARPILDVTAHRIYDLRIAAEFGAGATSLQDAYVEARFHPAAKVRVGKFKVPLGLERLQSATDNLFVERALPTNLVPNRDVGIQIGGETAEGVFGYTVGVFNGVPDGGSADADLEDSKDRVARLWFQPFNKSPIAALKGLGVGVAASHGAVRGTPSATGLAGFRTAGQASFFGYLAPAAGMTPTAADTVVAAGRRFRLTPQLYWSAGRFGLLAEYVTVSHEVRIDTSEAELEHTAWQATASFFLTNDLAAWRGVSPRRPFTPGTGTPGPGAIEMVARRGGLKVDREAFPTFASPTASAREARESALGVSWHLNGNVKAMLDYSRTTFTGGAAGGADREDETVLFTRLQLAF